MCLCMCVRMRACVHEWVCVGVCVCVGGWVGVGVVVVVVVVCLLGNLNRTLRPPYRVPEMFHISFCGCFNFALLIYSQLGVCGTPPECSGGPAACTVTWKSCSIHSQSECTCSTLVGTCLTILSRRFSFL